MDRKANPTTCCDYNVKLFGSILRWLRVDEERLLGRHPDWCPRCNGAGLWHGCRDCGRVWE